MEYPIKLKHRPEDFRIDEASDLELKKTGDYAVYVLSKKNQNTVDAIRDIVVRLDLGGLGDFGYGGKKDKHALTTQYISYHGKRFLDQKQEGYEARFVGFMDRPMGPDLVTGNRFVVKVRNVPETFASRVHESSPAVAEMGFENYFDDQRFGNYDPDHGWFAERLLKEQFNGALKAHLCSIYPEDSDETRLRKETFFKKWRNWPALTTVAKTKYEKLCVYTLIRKADAFLPLLRKLPRDDMAFHFTAYQAFFWNEAVRRLLSEDGLSKRTLRYSGRAGDYLFFDRPADRAKWLCETDLPTLSSVLPKVVSDPLFWDVYRRLISERGLKRAEFNDLKTGQYRFESRPRRILVRPEGLKSTVETDEYFSGKKCLELRFSLPRASYASMLVKRLFADEVRRRRREAGPARRD